MPIQCRALVVDDDAVQRTVVASWIESAGFEVQSYNSPIGTTLLLKSYRPHLLVLDVEMPVLTGPALVEAIKKNVKPPWPHVIFFSGKDRTKLDQLSQKPPVLGAIQKTRDAAYFLAQLRTLIVTVRKEWT